MDEEHWLTCTDPTPMLEFLGDVAESPMFEFAQSQVGSRKMRLFACACCRRLGPLLSIPRSRRAVEVAERYADRQASAVALVGAALSTLFHRPHTPDHIPGAAASLVAFTRALPERHATGCAWHAAEAVADASPDASESMRRAERAAQAALVRDIFGNPFRTPPGIDPAWLIFNNGTVKRLAEAAYQERLLPQGTLDPGRLAVLADALEEAGCADADLLGHLRGPGPHVLGCWCVDLLLGKS
jgi:hypothetical protein